MGSEGHVTGIEDGTIVWVSGNIIKEYFDRGGCVFGGDGLLRTNGAEGNKKFVVNGPCIVEEGANDGLNTLDAGVVEFGGGVFFWSKLLLNAKYDFVVLMG